MRISELSRDSGVSTPTIKYYVRERLLPRGEPTAATQADYGPDHLRRLRLIRALVDVAGLPIADVRRVVETVEGGAPLHQALGTIQDALIARPADLPGVVDPAEPEVDHLIDERGWHIGPDSPARGTLARAITSLRSVGWPVLPDDLDALAGRMAHTAATEMARLAASSPDSGDIIELAAAAMALGERLLVAIYRLAQEDASSRAFPGG